jgi:hypothetical protein
MAQKHGGSNHPGRRRGDRKEDDVPPDADVSLEDVTVTWSQPQPRYPAPERPLDVAEERKRKSA